MAYELALFSGSRNINVDKNYFASGLIFLLALYWNDEDN
jgi:hypothetical protein